MRSEKHTIKAQQRGGRGRNVGRPGGRSHLCLASVARSLEDALCNESDGVYLSEQERVPPPPRAAAKDGGEWKEGRGREGRRCE